ncbi:MAG: ABC transporter ATP-binding protein [Planctomycetota bacterium]
MSASDSSGGGSAGPSGPVGSDPADAVIRCAALTKVFKDFWLRPRVEAVSSLDMEVRRGEVFGLLGPNGSGKSTTIKLILGLLRPSSGRVTVFGRPSTDVSNKKRVGYLPEESYLYPFLTAEETLAYYGRLYGLDGRAIRERTDALLSMVGLEHARRRPVGEFSKGMMRKVGLAQSLINDPELLILDEPTSGMDPIATADVKRVIRRLRDRGKTIVLCSHLLADVEDVTDRVVIMFGGKARRHGPVGDLLERKDRTVVSLAGLEGIGEDKMVAALEAIGLTDLSVEHPRQKLEELFLEIVRRAQQEGVATSGARSGGAIAGFLNEASAGDDERSAEAASAAVLASLQAVDHPADAPAAPAASSGAGSSQDPGAGTDGLTQSEVAGPASGADGVNDDLLSSLTGTSDAQPSPEATTPGLGGAAESSGAAGSATVGAGGRASAGTTGGSSEPDADASVLADLLGGADADSGDKDKPGSVAGSG